MSKDVIYTPVVYRPYCDRLSIEATNSLDFEFWILIEETLCGIYSTLDDSIKGRTHVLDTLL